MAHTIRTRLSVLFISILTGCIAVFMADLMKPLDKLGVCSLNNTAMKFFTDNLKNIMQQRKESPEPVVSSDSAFHLPFRSVSNYSSNAGCTSADFSHVLTQF